MRLLMHSVSLCTPIAVPLFQGCGFASYLSSMITRVYQLSLKHFSLLQSGFVAGFGLKEVLIDFIPGALKIPPEKKQNTFKLIEDRVAECKPLHNIEAINKEFSLVHGCLYFGCGVSGAIEAANQLSWLDLGAAASVFKYMTAGFFLYANLYSLEQNINLYFQAELLEKEEKHQALAASVKISSVLGILNNLGYIVLSICSLFPTDEILYLIIACLAIFVGCLKIIYDFFFLSPALKELEGQG